LKGIPKDSFCFTENKFEKNSKTMPPSTGLAKAAFAVFALCRFYRSTVPEL
jgi:hypothetical protein